MRHVCTFDIPKGMVSKGTAGIGDMPGDFQPTEAMILESPDLMLMWMWAPERKSGLFPDSLRKIHDAARRHQQPRVEHLPGGPDYGIMGAGFAVAESVQRTRATLVDRHRLMFVTVFEPVHRDSMKTAKILDSIRWLSDGE